MSEDLREQFGQLMADAWRAGHTETGTALAAEAARVADILNDRELQWEARDLLVSHATFAGRPRDALVAFSWLLATCDRDPAGHDDAELMWSYKWVAGNLYEFPDISRHQIERTFDDMERRYRANGLSLKAVYKLRFDAAWKMGDGAVWRANYDLWQNAPNDGSQDCKACERDELVDYALRNDEPAKALELAKPILAGRMHCSTVPHRTIAKLLAAVRSLDQPEQAELLARRLQTLISRDPAHVMYYGPLMQHTAAVGDVARGLKLLEGSMGKVKGHTSPEEAFNYWLGARVLLARACQTARKGTRKLRLPESFEGWRADGEYELAELLKHVGLESDRLAAAFDARNGNDRYARLVAEACEH